MRLFAAALLGSALSTAAPALAADIPMSAEAFEDYTTGKTLHFGLGGTVYGSEQYLPGRRVLWAFLGEPCVEGIWYPEGDAICFLYENRETPQCWNIFRAPGGLTATVVDDPNPDRLYEVQQSREPLECPGPRVGV